jgi:hypothetical protein
LTVVLSAIFHRKSFGGNSLLNCHDFWSYSFNEIDEACNSFSLHLGERWE